MNLQELRGHWALVTGSSRGIGREFAVQLAASGMNLVLIARTEDLLRDLSGTLRTRYHVEIVVIALDLTEDDALSRIQSVLDLKGIKIRLLINNAVSACWGNFERIPPSSYFQMIKLNLWTAVSFCHHFFEDLRSFPSSAIINVASPASFNPVPYMAVYAATKSFIFNFSQALHGEWAPYGIVVQTLIPGPTETDLGKAAATFSHLFRNMAPADKVVKKAIEHLSHDSPVVIAADNTLKQRLFTTFFPRSFVIKILARMFRPAAPR